MGAVAKYMLLPVTGKVRWFDIQDAIEDQYDDVIEKLEEMPLERLKVCALGLPGAPSAPRARLARCMQDACAAATSLVQACCMRQAARQPTVVTVRWCALRVALAAELLCFGFRVFVCSLHAPSLPPYASRSPPACLNKQQARGAGGVLFEGERATVFAVAAKREPGFKVRVRPWGGGMGGESF